MKFSADRGTLLQTMAKAQGIADKKSSVNNILAHVLLESVDADSIRVKCTDYDVVLIATFPAKVEEPGRIAVNARSFFDSLRLWQDATVTVETTTGGNVSCRCGRTHANLMVLDPGDFPTIEKHDEGEILTIPARVLGDVAARMLPFMSDDPSRMNLNGMLMKLKPSPEGVQLTTVATDGHRLAILERELPSACLEGEERLVIVHRKGVGELRRLLDDGSEGDALLGLSTGEVFFRSGAATLYVRQIDEEYPNYSGVIPGRFVGELRVNRTELIHAVKIASPIADSHSQGIRMVLARDRVVISGSRSDLGNVETEIFAEYEGPDLTVGYNLRFLLESLVNVDSEHVTLGLTGHESPSLLRPADESEKSLFVIMPMELS
ncbi:MAG: DNA polymerase III subunit beta [Deltaproteobacteria bacterium]|nr:DNA polymerase III subunit beta [Deltaproteobacteria bacterium]